MTASFDQLTNPANLRAFAHAALDITGASVTRVVQALFEVMERRLCLRSDDTNKVWRPDARLQVVRVERASSPQGRTRNRRRSGPAGYPTCSST
jgi:hypothetical protein